VSLTTALYAAQYLQNTERAKSAPIDDVNDAGNNAFTDHRGAGYSDVSVRGAVPEPSFDSLRNVTRGFLSSDRHGSIDDSSIVRKSGSKTHTPATSPNKTGTDASFYAAQYLNRRQSWVEKKNILGADKLNSSGSGAGDDGSSSERSEKSGSTSDSGSRKSGSDRSRGSDVSTRSGSSSASDSSDDEGGANERNLGSSNIADALLRHHAKKYLQKLQVTTSQHTTQAPAASPSTMPRTTGANKLSGV